MAEKIIETMNLTKKYGDFTAVNNLNMSVDEGDIFGFLGPNGAGKTTTFLMLMGLSLPSSGTATVGGFDIVDSSREVRRLASILPENSSLYGNLTAYQNLNFIGKLNDMERDEREKLIPELLDIVSMTEWSDAKFNTFSRGMKQRVGLASVLLKKPKIIFLDEPTIGLDPMGTREIRELIINLNKEQGLTVILSSHLLDEVQKTCTRVGIINKGELVVTDSLQNLSKDIDSLGGRQVEYKLSETPMELVHNLEELEGVKSVSRVDDMLVVYCPPESDHRVSKAIMEHGSVILMMKTREFSLEEIFMKYYEDEP